MKAKTKLTSLWSILLALVMVAGLLPMGQVVYAEDTTSINEVYLTYDTSKIILNTAYTEGEVNTLILNNISSVTSGVSVDPGNSGLRYLNGTSIFGIGDGTGQITEGRTYLVEYRLEVATNYGFDWIDKSDTTSIKFYLNGAETTPYKITYNSSWNSYRVFFTLGTPTTEPIVKSVSIDQSDVSVQAGNSYNFTATVAGNVADKTVTWSVSGANSSDTKISDEGVLSVGSDETAKSVTVTATSNSDSSKSASQPVTITAAPLTIDSVTVSPKMKTLYTGDTFSFTVTVTGTENDKSVTWSVTGQTSESTAITSDGTLTVGKDEAPKIITVKAVSNADSTKYGEASITIYQKVFIDNVSLTYDASKVNLNTAYTEGEVDTLICNNISSETKGVSVNPGNSGLFYLNGTTIYGIGDGTGQITEGRTYLLCYRLEVATYSGYDWADKSDTTAIKFYLNGAETTPYKIRYNSSNSYYVYFTLGTATAAPHTHTFDQETIKDAALKTAADCTHDAVYYKSCSCGIISTDDADTFTDTGSALGHAWPEEGSWSKDADKHWYECSRCHLKKDEVAHTAGDWIIDTAATATATGTKHKECTVCGYVTETETIPAIVSEYTVTFNANGHGKAPTAQTVKIGMNATKPTNPTEEGWTFCGWYTDADCTNYFDFSTAITEDTTLYAKWRQNETASQYWCGIYSDRSPYGMVNLDKVNLPSTVVGQVFDAGTELTAYAYPDDGYRFKEWQNEAGDVVSTNNPYTFTLNSEICLYAIFESAPASSTEYTITVTDGKATSSTGAEISQAAEGTTVTLTANAAPTGKEFDKWVVVSGSITLADASNATTIFTMPKGNVEIKATYKDEPGSDIKYGDLNSDGKINLLDLVAMRKYLAKWSITVDKNAADCNADGKINLMDLILLRKYLAKWSVTLGPQK